MSEESERRLFGRQRRANSEAPRDRRYVVRVNAAEDAQLTERASAAGVTVPRLMFEASMNTAIETTTDRQQTIAELFRVSRRLGTVANNVNQLAKFANTEGQFPADAVEVVAEYRQMVARIDETIRKLAGA